MAASFVGSRRQGIHRALIFVDLTPHSTPHVTSVPTYHLNFPTPCEIGPSAHACCSIVPQTTPSPFTGLRVFGFLTSDQKTCLYTHRSLLSHRCLPWDCSRTGAVDTRTHSVFVIPPLPSPGRVSCSFVDCLRRSGAAGIRTPDLRRARAALSQLSYDPICFYRRRSPLLPSGRAWTRTRDLGLIRTAL